MSHRGLIRRIALLVAAHQLRSQFPIRLSIHDAQGCQGRSQTLQVRF